MSYKPKQFIVRGLDVVNTVFDSRGFLNTNPHSSEEVVKDQHAATLTILASTPYNSMACPKALPTGVTLSVSTDRLVDQVKLKIYTHSVTVDKHDRERIFKMVKAWAEKSRVRGKRGWRANAVKELRWERNVVSGKMVAHTTVLLGTQVFYNEKASATSPVDLSDYSSDVDLLRKELDRAGIVSLVSTNHRVFGPLTV